MRVLALLLTATVLSTFAYAGDKGNMIGPKGTVSAVTNGYLKSGSIVCRDKDNLVKKAYLLDYAELDSVKSSLISFDSRIDDLTFIHAMANILEREAPDLFQGFRYAGSRIAAQSMNFMMNRNDPKYGVDFISMQPVVEMGDGKVYKLPKNFNDCINEKTITAQKDYRGVRFIVQADIFAKLSQRDRRGLILHEALFYSIERYYGDIDSARTRYIHQRLVQLSLSELTPVVVSDILTRSYIDFRTR